MKLKHVVAIIALSSVSAFGASITVTNGNGPVFTQSVVDNAGNAVDGGYAAIGNFDASVLDTALTSSALDGAFQLFDGAEGAINNAPFLGSFTVQSGGGVPLNAANDFSGNPIYLVLGNGPDLISSTQAAVVQLGSFPASEPTLDTQIVSTTNGTVLLGSFENWTLNPSTVPNRNNAALSLQCLTLLCVPEPSSSLLMGLAGLSLLIRRRR